ncbi:UNKNOWN [Stylonychia lemnae]|uniref:Uncharacterized protein n=1 Tax=Stylonychia lemnae TaxID=5949 RepID=A0A078B9P2_STYLE|nr:UNKNOWN [Stylonychia lemnae]|eukprot:CDW90901.1 UNKNOWN [Stylonychia lemnae]
MSQDGSKDEEIYEEIPRQYLNRGHYMENMKFPDNSNELIIIPSNRKGTGFIKTCYDPRLKGIMSEQEFKFVIEQAAKINAKAYSEKRIGDAAQTPKWFVWILTISSSLTGVVMLMLYLSIFQDDPTTILMVAYSILATCLTLVSSVMILNYKSKDASTVPFTKIVKVCLDEYFDKVNRIYAKRGLQWKVAPGYYWIELSIDTTMKRNQKNMIYEAPGVFRTDFAESIKSPAKLTKANTNSIQSEEEEDEEGKED